MVHRRTHQSEDATSRKSFPRTPLVPLAFVALAVGAVWYQLTFIPIHLARYGILNNQVDLRVYRAGASALRHGQPLYDGPILAKLKLLYTYPPFSTVTFQPFSWISQQSAEILWSALIFAVLLWVVLAGFRCLGYRWSWQLVTVSASLVAICALMEPLRSTILFGQVNVFLMGVIMWDLLRPKGSRLQGVATGLAAGVKLTPLFFVVYLVMLRRFRAAIMVVVAFVGTVAVGFLFAPGSSWKYWSGSAVDSQRISSPLNPSNQSLRGAIASVTGSDTPNTAVWIVACVVALALGMGASYVAYQHGNRLLALSIAGMCSTTVSPFSWGHHWVWFVPLMVCVVDVLVQGINARRIGMAVAGAVGAVALFAAVFPAVHFVPRMPGAGGPRYYTGWFMTIAPDQWRWFTAQPYLWVFAVTAVTVLAVWGPNYLRTRRSERGLVPAGTLGT